MAELPQPVTARVQAVRERAVWPEEVVLGARLQDELSHAWELGSKTFDRFARASSRAPLITSH